MLRLLALIGTVGMMAMAINTASAQQAYSCQTCDNSGGVYDAGVYETGDCNKSCCSLCSTKGFPDKGWNPPARLPVNRDGIWYRNYWPQAWYGNSGGGFIGNSPMVYQPTDTTQLGYSYAKVPTWQARCMIPPTPSPSCYHARMCVPRTHNGCLADGCSPGDPSNCGDCQSCQQGFAMNTMPGYGVQTAAIQPVTEAPASSPATFSQPVGAPPKIVFPRTTEVEPAITSLPVARSMMNASFQNRRPVRSKKRTSLFQLIRRKSLFQ